MASRRLRRPDGYYHGRITLWLSPVAAALCVLIASQLHPEQIIVAGVLGFLGCLLGLIVDPDLDQEMVSSSEWRLIKIPIIGKIIGTAWVSYWFFYALIMPHRKMSHWPIIGTLTRVAWMAWPFILLSYFQIWRVPLPSLAYLLYAFLGLCISDLGHWWRDFKGKWS